MSSDKPIVWVVKDGEELPITSSIRISRTGLLAAELERRGCDVAYFGSRFNHARKVFLEGDSIIRVSDSYQLILLDGCGYNKNISASRVRHYHGIASHFLRIAPQLPRPELILASYPSPELCEAVSCWSNTMGIPLLVDVRDPWPDSFSSYFPAPLRLAVVPILSYYRGKLRRSLRLARGVISMSKCMHAWAMGYAGRELGPADAVFYLGCPEPGSVPTNCPPEQFSESEPLRCIFVGMFGHTQDGDSLIEAIRLLKDGGERRIECRMVGDGPKRAEWERRAEGLPIVFTGYLDQAGLNAELARSHVGLILVAGEIGKFWMGNKFFEYSARGLAVVNTALGELAAVIKERELGMNLSQGAPSELVTALQQYLNSPNRLRDDMRRSQAAFRSDFEAGAIYRQFAEHLLREVRGVDFSLTMRT